MKKQEKSFPPSPIFANYLKQLTVEVPPPGSETQLVNKDEIQSQVNDSVDELQTTEVSDSVSALEIGSDQPETSTEVNIVNEVVASESSQKITVLPENADKQIEPVVALMDTPARKLGEKPAKVAVKPDVSPKKLATVDELTAFLTNLNSAKVTRQGYNKDEMQVRLDRDLTMVLRNLPAYLMLLDDKTIFHIDALVNHLLRQFVQDNKSAFNEVSKQLAKAETIRQQRVLDTMNLIDIS